MRTHHHEGLSSGQVNVAGRRPRLVSALERINIDQHLEAHCKGEQMHRQLCCGVTLLYIDGDAIW